MDKIEKLLRKISQADRQRLLTIVAQLAAGQRSGLNVRKLRNSDLYRLRSGRFRIIFHYESKQPVIDSIRLRNEKTYH